ncbi:transposase [Kitasatospora acidiphila]|uniref:Transposase n=1 Tax=Kitasatospora acidiphila TaxID=2567942 RepID=A0A540WF91_9ACTN|nr:transposase [Kitasatospora acidiphila]
MEKIRVPRTGPGRPRKKPDSLAADKAYSNGPCRACLRERGIRHAIPEKTDSQGARRRKGSRGGRPPGFDEERYKSRNTVERAINKPKNARGVATRSAALSRPAGSGQGPRRRVCAYYLGVCQENSRMASL